MQTPNDAYEIGLQEYRELLTTVETAADNAGMTAVDHWLEFDADARSQGDRAPGLPKDAYQRGYTAFMDEARPEIERMEATFIPRGR